VTFSPCFLGKHLPSGHALPECDRQTPRLRKRPPVKPSACKKKRISRQGLTKSDRPKITTVIFFLEPDRTLNLKPAIAPKLRSLFKAKSNLIKLTLIILVATTPLFVNNNSK
jgi:hypothetical protein